METPEPKEDVADHKQQPMFVEINADENGFTEMSSLCMNCREQGTTRLLLTKIPFFKEIILMAFTCDECGFRSNEVQSGGAIQELGCRIEYHISNGEDGVKDLDRQVVKSDSATIIIPDLEFEIPPSTQRGTLNTLEGFLTSAISHLKDQQPARKSLDPIAAEGIDVFLQKLERLKNREVSFTFIVDDPAGNSFIEKYVEDDSKLKFSYYKRTAEQNEALGLTSEINEEEEDLKRTLESKKDGKKEVDFKKSDDVDSLMDGKQRTKEIEKELKYDDYQEEKEVMSFAGNCSNCHFPTQTNMVVVNIPYFKDVVIMAAACDSCGYKSNEVKCGGAIPTHGIRLTLKVTKPEDMNRNILKSETANVKIPEMKFHVTQGTLGGRFTTLEGLIDGIREDLRCSPFMGDSSSKETNVKWTKFLKELEQLMTGKVPFTIILDDPVGNSFIQNPNAPEPDPNLTVEEYERTWQQDEDLGLHDMKTEDYNESDETYKQSSAPGNEPNEDDEDHEDYENHDDDPVESKG